MLFKSNLNERKAFEDDNATDASVFLEVIQQQVLVCAGGNISDKDSPRLWVSSVKSIHSDGQKYTILEINMSSHYISSTIIFLKKF